MFPSGSLSLACISHQEKNLAGESIERRTTSPAMTLFVAKAALTVAAVGH
jgi:hypothetical protein